MSLGDRYPQPNTRETLAKEILEDQELKELMIFGLNGYLNLLVNPESPMSDNEIDISGQRGTSAIRYLIRAIDDENFDANNFPKVSDSSFTGNSGENITQVILGDRPNEGDTQMQICVRAKMISDAAKNTAIASLAFREPPEKIVVDRGIPDNRFHLSVSNRTVRQTNGRIEILDTSGVEIVFNDAGKPLRINGITFKNQVPHFTDDLIGTKIKPEDTPIESIDKIQAFCMS